MKNKRFWGAYCIALFVGAGAAIAGVVSLRPDVIQPESMYEKVAPRGDKVVGALVGLMLTPQTFAPEIFRLARPDELIKRARVFSHAGLWPPPALH